ncbi:xanthine dehydrogenase family protein molybdopterin-binding subunit [Sphingomonas sp. AP4-R1]|uniref:aldehyde oxidoreductase molybdenum-binding subunit PaoC n=1 Tax=Sphingomonas sp. AP4-R1 TaxID=2735134 RepID=UPI00149395FA|nr:aldehyde oxidoreductase molybdenum-binding subunit PaoC [Sphingomonas sp. AP4-R1]QJU56979.1 xanthine dehydrogenase family protein molybdopterin-binding subunit [Sphingomonas sp. AP4-R1]
MKYETPVGDTPFDRQRVIGQPHDRIDGPRKVTGTAPYAYEQHEAAPAPAYGVIVYAGVAKGRITAIDREAARRAPGVLAILSYQDVPRMGPPGFYKAPVLAGPDVHFYHQAVAIAVAETFEQARDAAALVRVSIDRQPGAYDLAATRAAAKAPKGNDDTVVGDFATAFAAAPVTLDATYHTPDQSHCMMEPHATIAAWDGDELTLWSAQQLVSWAQRDLGSLLGVPKEKIRIVTPFIGGGFGGKGSVGADAVMAALGARAAGRPVKVAHPRPAMINNTTHRPATIQRIRLGAERDGRLTAIAHESLSGNVPGGMAETAADQSNLLYAGVHRLIAHRLGLLDLPEGSAMRAPGEAPGMMALEVAMDELAEKLGMDPVALRILNDTQVNPAEPGKRFSSRMLVECLREGAQRFGWSRRGARVGQMRDGRWIVGMGMASAIRGAPTIASAARVRLETNGRLTVETDMTDIGTGSYTILGQTAAEMLGLPLAAVDVTLGDSLFPTAAGSGGQFGAASSTSGVYAACVKLREAIAAKLGLDPAAADFSDGHVRVGNDSRPLADALSGGALAGEDRIEWGALKEQYEQQTFGAHFCEVGVDAYTGEVRVRRMLAVCAAGRILNPKQARSQVIGGMTMGIGAALTEELAIDPRFGLFINHDLASYEVPVHADVPHLDAVFLDELDPIASPLKAKGVGELGISGVAAAVANAMYNATGARVRDYPLTLDKYLDRLPAVA